MPDVSTRDLVRNAWQAGKAVPSFNIPYLPMMAPTVQALRDTNCVGLIAVARLEWVKFGAEGIEAIRDEYERVKDVRYTRLHLDHVPVIDEDERDVDYLSILARALELGYESVMVDGSRLTLEENIATTRAVVELAAKYHVPVEAELGAVLGHEAGPMPPYEELFASGRGFTDPDEAKRFVDETGVDWLSVAIGNVHGALSKAARQEKKLQARLNTEHLRRIRETVAVPLVLHGGTGIRKSDVLASMRDGIAKINIATATRQPFMALTNDSVERAQEAAYAAALAVIRDDLELENSRDEIITAHSQ